MSNCVHSPSQLGMINGHKILKGYIKAIYGHRPPQFVVFKGYNLSKDPVARIPDNPGNINIGEQYCGIMKSQ